MTVLGINSAFDRVYVSSICETSKNEEKFFDMVINDYNIKENEATFIDDFDRTCTLLIVGSFSLKMARLMKKLHTTEFEPGTFPDARDILHKWIELPFSKGLLTAEDKALVDSVIDGLPRRNTFIHLDYHPKNVMLSNDELVLIDVGDAGLGHPIADLMVSYAHLVFIGRLAAQHGSGDKAAENHGRVVMGLEHKTLEAVWNIMMPEYFGTTDTETLRHYEDIISSYVPIFQLYGLSVAPVPEEKRVEIITLVMEHFRKDIPTLKLIEGI